MRRLSFDDATIEKLLNQLDAQHAQYDSEEDEPREKYCTYRVPALQIELDHSRDRTIMERVHSRALGRNGLYVVVGSSVHVGRTCRAHLVTIRNNWRVVPGRISHCRYLPGTGGAHEVYIVFDRPIDPVSFAASATRVRVLAADDSPVSRALYQHLFSGMNVELTLVNNGEEAVERAMRDPFDLLLMDLVMPDLDGVGAVQTLRDHGYIRPIVIVSVQKAPEDRQYCLDAGCDDYLSKPLTRDALEAVVQRNTPEPMVSEFVDDAGMVEMIDQFVASLSHSMSQLESAYAAQDLAALERTARFVKGEAGGVGFPVITDAAAVIEDAAKRGEDWSGLRTKLTELMRLCLAARPVTAEVAEMIVAGASENDVDADAEDRAQEEGAPDEAPADA